METLLGAIAAGAAAGIFMGLAMATHWGLNKWRPNTSWKASLLVTGSALFVLGLLAAALD